MYCAQIIRKMRSSMIIHINIIYISVFLKPYRYSNKFTKMLKIKHIRNRLRGICMRLFQCIEKLDITLICDQPSVIKFIYAIISYIKLLKNCPLLTKEGV